MTSYLQKAFDRLRDLPEAFQHIAAEAILRNVDQLQQTDEADAHESDVLERAA